MRLFLVRLSSLYCEQMTGLFKLIHTNMKMINRLFLFVFPQQSLDDWQVISSHTGGTFLHDGYSWQSAAVWSVWDEFTAASCFSFSVHLSVHTWECPVSSVDPPVQQTAASLLNLLDDCSSPPALSDGRGWSSELRPEKHSLPLWSDILTDWNSENKVNSVF